MSPYAVFSNGSRGNDSSVVANHTREGVLQPEVAELVLEVCYYIIGSLGIVGNLMVVIVMCSMKDIKKKAPGLYITNLAVADFIAAIVLVIGAAVPDDRRVYKTLADLIYCKVWKLQLPLWFFIHMSTWNLVALTIERYLAVVHPIKHRVTFTPAKAMVVIAALWVLQVVYYLSIFQPTTKVIDGICFAYVFKSQVGRSISGTISFMVHYFVPIAILLFCYSRMAHVLNQKVAPVAVAAGLHGAPGHQKLLARRNTIRTLIIVSVAFFVCASWINWFFFLFNIGVFDLATFNSSATYRHISAVLMVANCCINPIIYTVKYKAFQLALKQLFISWKAKVSTINSFATTSTSGHSTSN